MRILRAEHMGWCFGVRDAVQRVLQEAQRQPVTVLGELVHNETVNDGLRARGVTLETQPGEVNTGTVVITAHGTSDVVRQEAQEHFPKVVDTTCPLVRAAHDAVKRLVADGFHPVIIGQRNHVEVRGLTGDLDTFDVVLTAADVAALPAGKRFGVVAQTTQPMERVRWLTGLIRDRFPKAEVRLVDTVCLPTKQRQASAVELAQHCDAVVVIGGINSNNTRELAETCGRYCRHVFRIERASELRREMFVELETVGITAGTSTPDEVIDEVEQWLLALAAQHAHGVAA